MSFVDKVSIKYPGVKWTGRSSIHVSRMGTVFIPNPKMNAEEAQKAFHEKDLLDGLYRYVTNTFNGFGFIYDKAEFRTMLETDLLSMLDGGGPVQAPSDFQNPVTGNFFHFLGVDGEYHCGIRVWIEDYGQFQRFMFRFRIVAPTTDHEKNLVKGLQEEDIPTVEEIELEFEEPYKNKDPLKVTVH